MIVIYVYYVLLAVYVYEFHKMFSSVYTEKLTPVISHVVMLIISLIVLYQFYSNYIIYALMWEEFASMFVISSAVGAFIALGGIFIHLRAYFNPKYR